MKKLSVTAIKMFLREPVIEFTRPDGGRSIKTLSLLDKEEIELTKDVVLLELMPKLGATKEQVVKKSNRDECFADKLNRVISQREKLTNTDISIKSGLTVRHIRKLRNDRNTNPSLNTIYKLADALDCDAAELV